MQAHDQTFGVTWGQALGVMQAAVCALVLAACTLPSVQLELPGPITGSTAQNRLETNNHKYGIPTANDADPETQAARVYTGTGQFTGAANGQPYSDSGRAGHSVDGKGVTLNLVGASIAETAKAILGDVLGLNYVVSDKVKGSITLSTTKPIAKDDLLEVFESVLQSEGAALIVSNDVYQIVPAETARAQGAPPTWRQGKSRQKGGVVSEVIPLRFVAANEMERVIKSVAPNTMIARVDKARNLLIVTGNQREIASIRDTVSVFDVDWMKGMSFAFLPIESADPEVIARELDTIFANDSDGPSKGIVRFVPNKRLKSVLVITSQPEYLRKAQGWLRRIDMAGKATEKKVHVYHVQYRPATELALLLRKVYAREASAGLNAGPATQPTEPTTILSAPEIGQSSGNINIAAPEPISTASFTDGPSDQTQPSDGATDPGDPNAAAAAEAAAAADTADRRSNDRTSGISIVSDEPNNSLVITATHEEYRRIREVLWRIDVAPHQVLLEATIAEISLNDRLRYGIRWFFQSGESSFRLTDAALGAVAPAFPGFSYFLNMPNIQVALDALSDVTDVNVVSSPSLMVLDNKRAVLQVGAEVPIATQTAVSVAAPGAPIVNSISFRNTGVILGITPRVSDNGRILLDIEQEVSDVIATTSSNLDSPTIQQRRIRTTVAVGDGETIVLAGFIQDRTTISKSQVPLLADIPYIGNAFKSKNNNIERTELLIAITPQVVKDQNQIRSIAAEFRDRMNFTTRPQRRGPPDRRENFERLIVR